MMRYSFSFHFFYRDIIACDNTGLTKSGTRINSTHTHLNTIKGARHPSPPAHKNARTPHILTGCDSPQSAGHIATIIVPLLRGEPVPAATHSLIRHSLNPQLDMI